MASRLGYNNRVDYYAEIDIIDDTCKPNRGAIKKINKELIPKIMIIR